MAQDELNQILESKIKLKKKTQLLLTQIGYLRINMFGEYYEQINRAQERKELDKAVELMNKCAEAVGLPFLSTKKQRGLIERLKGLISTKKQPEPAELIRKWKTAYETWFKKNESPRPQTDDKKRMEEFDQLKMLFFTIYTYSFSVENFPPLRNRRSDH